MNSALAYNKSKLYSTSGIKELLFKYRIPQNDLTLSKIKTGYESDIEDNLKRSPTKKILKESSQNIVRRTRTISHLLDKKPITEKKRSKENVEGGKQKLKHHYNGKKYTVHIGKKGGRYIIVGKEKKKLYIKN
jgi:hypothetical protein